MDKVQKTGARIKTFEKRKKYAISHVMILTPAEIKYLTWFT